MGKQEKTRRFGMSKDRDDFVSAIMAKMSLGEKVGQTLTFTWRGAYLTPSGVEQITKLHAGGVCLEPYALETCKNLYWGRSQVDSTFKKPKDYFDIAHTYFDDHNYGVSVTPEELTGALNALQKIALSRPAGIPLHVTIDMEGDFKNDYTSGGIRQFIPPMGLTAIGDPEFTYKVAYALGRQMAAIGVTQFYHPVCDVNINPKNPEIGVRSFGDDPAVCARHVEATVRGYQDAGVVATAKHFAGRGDSATDAHDVLDVCRADYARMHAVELVTFSAAVKAGVKAVMTAHTIFPAYDKVLPATLSPAVLTGLLRQELGFEGVIVSDAIGMAAILKKWPLPKACAMAIKAGVDTILLKADDESRSQCYFGIKSAIERGELSEERLNDAVRRLLNMKVDQGLFDKAGKMDPKNTTAVARSPEVIDGKEDPGRRTAHSVPVPGQGSLQPSAHVLRGDGQALPQPDPRRRRIPRLRGGCRRGSPAGEGRGPGCGDQLLRADRKARQQPAPGEGAQEGGPHRGRRHQLPVHRGHDPRSRCRRVQF
jgi:beta-N-acetylhexosaminidase